VNPRLTVDAFTTCEGSLVCKESPSFLLSPHVEANTAHSRTPGTLSSDHTVTHSDSAAGDGTTAPVSSFRLPQQFRPLSIVWGSERIVATRLSGFTSPSIARAEQTSLNLSKSPNHASHQTETMEHPHSSAASLLSDDDSCDEEGDEGDEEVRSFLGERQSLKRTKRSSERSSSAQVCRESGASLHSERLNGEWRLWQGSRCVMAVSRSKCSSLCLSYLDASASHPLDGCHA